MRQLLLALGACLLVSSSASAEATLPGSYYVTAPMVEVRLGPSASATITNRLYQRNPVDVFEVRNGWARVSKYYDGSFEGIAGDVARWVDASQLSTQRPDDPTRLKVESDFRISGIPKAGENGLTERDVLILRLGAKQFLASGRCKRIEYGDKSVSKPDTYYVNCGGPQNFFFRPSDRPRK